MGKCRGLVGSSGVARRKDVEIMGYRFARQKVSSFQIAENSAQGKTTFAGVDGEQADANVIVGGVQQLLSIVGWQNKYNPLDALRTVKENVEHAE